MVLKGDPTLFRSPVGLKMLTRTQDAEFWAVVIEGEPVKLMDSESPRVAQVLRKCLGSRRAFHPSMRRITELRWFQG